MAGCLADPLAASRHEPLQPQLWWSEWSTRLLNGWFAPLPPQAEVKKHIDRLKDGGLGPDFVSASVLRAGGWETSGWMHNLLMEAGRLRHVPLRWRGGSLATMHKKGSPKDTVNYRGLLVADHTSKVVTACVADNLATAYQKQVGDTRFGAMRRRSTAMASLSLRLFLEITSGLRSPLSSCFWISRRPLTIVSGSSCLDGWGKWLTPQPQTRSANSTS